jgi:hypothetical protein
MTTENPAALTVADLLELLDTLANTHPAPEIVDWIISWETIIENDPDLFAQMAQAHAYAASVQRTSPDEVVDRVLDFFALFLTGCGLVIVGLIVRIVK